MFSHPVQFSVSSWTAPGARHTAASNGERSFLSFPLRALLLAWWAFGPLAGVTVCGASGPRCSSSAWPSLASASLPQSSLSSSGCPTPCPCRALFVPLLFGILRGAGADCAMAAWPVCPLAGGLPTGFTSAPSVPGAALISEQLPSEHVLSNWLPCLCHFLGHLPALACLLYWTLAEPLGRTLCVCWGCRVPRHFCQEGAQVRL